MGAELRDHRRPPPGLARVQADVQRTVDAGEVRLSESSPSATRFRRAGRGRVEVITFKPLSKNPGALQRERWRQALLDVGQKTGAVDRAIKHGRRGEACHAQRPEKRRGVPAAIRRVVGDPGAGQPAAIAANQIGPHTTLIEKHEARGIERRRRGAPDRAGAADVSAIVFRRVYRFFQTGSRAV